MVKLNLQKIEKNLQKKLHFGGFEAVRGQIPEIFFFTFESYPRMVPPVKEFF